MIKKLLILNIVLMRSFMCMGMWFTMTPETLEKYNKDTIASFCVTYACAEPLVTRADYADKIPLSQVFRVAITYSREDITAQLQQLGFWHFARKTDLAAKLAYSDLPPAELIKIIQDACSSYRRDKANPPLPVAAIKPAEFILLQTILEGAQGVGFFGRVI